jgi:hypothetical protein
MVFLNSPCREKKSRKQTTLDFFPFFCKFSAVAAGTQPESRGGGGGGGGG